MDATLDQLADFVCTTSDDRVPPHVMDRARDILVDSLGCAVAGRDCPAADVAAGLGATTARDDGVVIGHADRAPVEIAAFWNSAMIRYLDFNDTGAPSGHPSDMIGAHVALSRLAAASGAEMLTAVVIGHEVYNRITDRLLFDDRRLDNGYGTALGIAAAGSHLLGLTADQTRQALSFAATGAVSTRAARSGHLSQMKGFATALAAKQAVFHLQLARAGLTAPSDPFEGRHGMVELVTGEPGPLELTPFGDWTIMSGKLKYWPAATNTQPSVWAALELRDRLAPADIASVTLGVSRRAWHESGSEAEKWDPQSRETADHSIPYLFARAFVDGVIEEASYAPAKLREPVVRDLMAKVRVVVEPELEAQRPKLVLGCRANVVDSEGVSHEAFIRGIPGDDAHPLSREQIFTKFLRLTSAVLGDRAVSAFDTAWNCAAAENFSRLLDEFRS